MEHKDMETLHNERLVHVRTIRLLLLAILPTSFILYWLVGFMARYLDVNWGLMEFVTCTFPIWLCAIGDKVWRLRQINKLLTHS